MDEGGRCDNPGRMKNATSEASFFCISTGRVLAGQSLATGMTITLRVSNVVARNSDVSGVMSVAQVKQVFERRKNHIYPINNNM